MGIFLSHKIMIFLLNQKKYNNRKYCKNKVDQKTTKKINWELKQSKRKKPKEKKFAEEMS
jgi:hypothetical protein